MKWLILAIWLSFVHVAGSNELIRLNSPMPSWINDPLTKKSKNNIYTNETYSVQGNSDNKIIWYKRFLTITGSNFGPPAEWKNEDGTSTSKYSHATIVYEEDGHLSDEYKKKFKKGLVNVECNPNAIMCDKLDRIKSWMVSLKAGPHKLVKVEVYYKEGDVTKMSFEYPFENTNTVLFSVEYGKKIN